MWIFGYGSLIWRPDFSYEERVLGFVQGWRRGFYQGSYDHRGVPGNPGRVVTLVPHVKAFTWGVAYRLNPDEAPAILEALDYREKGGYDRLKLPIYKGDPSINPRVSVPEALTYVATEENPHFLGPAPVEEIAEQVVSAEGPSGPNREYVLNLAASLQRFEVVDDHVFAVAKAVRALLE